MKKFLPIVTVIVVALIGVFIFQLFSLPMPWMLGSLFGVLIAQLLCKIPMKWPVYMRNIGLIIVGTAIGQLFTFNILVEMKKMFLFMLIFNLFLSLISLVIAFGLQKFSQIPFSTALISSIPGGLSQLVIFAEEEKEIDVAIVSYFHVIRVLCVVGLIPLIVSMTGHISKISQHVSTNLVHNLILMCISFIFIPIGRKLKLPVPYFLTPVVVGLLLNLVKINFEPIDTNLLHIAQLFIGSYIGLLLPPKSLNLPISVLIGGISSAILLLVVTFFIAKGMDFVLDIDFTTSYLSTAPGGMDQMGLVATALHADATKVTIFQLFRMLFIYIVILPLLKWGMLRHKKEIRSSCDNEKLN